MHLRVAVHATAALPHANSVQAGSTQGNRADIGGRVRRVALLTQDGCTRLENARDHAAMRVVAGGTVLSDWLMLMHERPALFSVAGVAGVVDAVALDKLGTGRTVRVVAIGTGHLAFGNRMVRGFVHLATLLLVAGVAGFRLCDLVQGLVAVGVHLVATVAGNIGRLVLATGPQGTLGVFVMARLANPAAVIGCQCRELSALFAKGEIRFGLDRDAGRLARVGLTGAMATNTVRGTLVGGKTVRRTTHVWKVFFVVTGDAERCASRFRIGAPSGAKQAK